MTTISGDEKDVTSGFGIGVANMSIEQDTRSKVSLLKKIVQSFSGLQKKDSPENLNLAELSPFREFLITTLIPSLSNRVDELMAKIQNDEFSVKFGPEFFAHLLDTLSAPATEIVQRYLKKPLNFNLAAAARELMTFLKPGSDFAQGEAGEFRTKLSPEALFRRMVLILCLIALYILVSACGIDAQAQNQPPTTPVPTGENSPVGLPPEDLTPIAGATGTKAVEETEVAKTQVAAQETQQVIPGSFTVTNSSNQSLNVTGADAHMDKQSGETFGLIVKKQSGEISISFELFYEGGVLKIKDDQGNNQDVFQFQEGGNTVVSYMSNNELFRLAELWPNGELHLGVEDTETEVIFDFKDRPDALVSLRSFFAGLPTSEISTGQPELALGITEIMYRGYSMTIDVKDGNEADLISYVDASGITNTDANDWKLKYTDQGEWELSQIPSELIINRDEKIEALSDQYQSPTYLSELSQSESITWDKLVEQRLANIKLAELLGVITVSPPDAVQMDWITKQSGEKDSNHFEYVFVGNVEIVAADHVNVSGELRLVITSAVMAAQTDGSQELRFMNISQIIDLAEPANDKVVVRDSNNADQVVGYLAFLQDLKNRVVAGLRILTGDGLSFFGSTVNGKTGSYSKMLYDWAYQNDQTPQIVPDAATLAEAELFLYGLDRPALTEAEARDAAAAEAEAENQQP